MMKKFIAALLIISAQVVASEADQEKEVALCMGQASIYIWWSSGRSVTQSLYARCNKGVRRSTEFKRQTLVYYRWILDEFKKATKSVRV